MSSRNVRTGVQQPPAVKLEEIEGIEEIKEKRKLKQVELRGTFRVPERT